MKDDVCGECCHLCKRFAQMPKQATPEQIHAASWVCGWLVGARVDPDPASVRQRLCERHREFLDAAVPQ